MSAAEAIQLVRFRLGEEEYALELETVVEIARPPAVRELAGPAGPAAAAARVAGAWLPLVDLRARMGIAADRPPRRVVILRNPEGGRFGLLVDSVKEVATVAAGDLLPPPPMFGGSGASIRALVRIPEEERLAMLISLPELFTSEELGALARFDGSGLSTEEER